MCVRLNLFKSCVYSRSTVRIRISPILKKKLVEKYDLTVQIDKLDELNSIIIITNIDGQPFPHRRLKIEANS